jgi:hypothetical protein
VTGFSKGQTITIDGLWHFHTGDNPAWADPNFDDSRWPLLGSDEASGQQGYKNYGGFAWYRFTVAVPEGSRNWSIYLGPMETEHMMFDMPSPVKPPWCIKGIAACAMVSSLARIQSVCD